MFPRRGALAALITAIALVALLNYKTPDYAPPDVSSPAGASAYLASSGSAWPAIAQAQTPSGALASSPAPTATRIGVVQSPSSARSGSTAGTPQPTIAGTTPTPGATEPPGTPTRLTLPPTAGGPTAPTAPTPTPAPPKGRTGTTDGAVAQMRYGPVQVAVVYSNGKIVDVTALQTPTGDSRSRAIAANAVPILRSEALSAQSASINTVSGATYTSQAYKTSLQSAIDNP